MKNIPHRLWFAATGLTAVALLAAAYYLQHGPPQQQPCPICILQRYMYIGIAAVSVLAALRGPVRVEARVYAVATALIAAGGAGLAMWQILKGSTMLACTEDPIGVFVNGLPMANWWYAYFLATGGCADNYPPILGLPVPVWSFVWFAIFLVLSGWRFVTLGHRRSV